MSDVLDQQGGPGQPERAPDPSPGRRLPRALTPFRTPAYRRLAVALVLNMFSWGVWVVALVWEVIRIGGGPAQLSLVSVPTRSACWCPACWPAWSRTGCRRR